MSERFETFEILPDNRCRVTCEFGSWVVGGSYHSGAKNHAKAREALSRLRYNAYWSQRCRFHISREQD